MRSSLIWLFILLVFLIGISCDTKQSESPKEKHTGPLVELQMARGMVTMRVISSPFWVVAETEAVRLTNLFDVPKSIILIKPKDVQNGCLYVLLFNEQKYGRFDGLADHIILLVPAERVVVGPLSCGVTLIRWKIDRTL